MQITFQYILESLMHLMPYDFYLFVLVLLSILFLLRIVRHMMGGVS